MKCDFCQSNELALVYPVPNSERGMQVYICEGCGLVQSIQTKEKNTERIVRTSSDANWGNVRHGKGIRLPKAKEIILPLFEKTKITRILDVGSNRGDFVLWVREILPYSSIDAVEPDGKVIETYKNNSGITVLLDRFEHLSLQEHAYDFIYCCHTLEHADSALAMLEKIYDLLKPEGYLYLDVPNIAIITEPDIVEEFFLDKHTFHFNRELLIAFVKQAGFSIISGEHDTDVSNITLLLQKNNSAQGAFPKKISLSQENKERIEQYKKLLPANREKLKAVADKLNELMERQKVVLWGGGRIFDALVRYGGLRTDTIYGVIDEYISKYVPEVHGVKLQKAIFLRMNPPDAVIILAKNAADEIYQQTKKYGIRHVFRFSDLLKG